MEERQAEEERKHNEKMLKIHNSKFKQQELPSWRPIATPLKTIVILSFFSAFFLGFGIKIRAESLKIWEIVYDYTNSLTKN